MKPVGLIDRRWARSIGLYEYLESQIFVSITIDLFTEAELEATDEVLMAVSPTVQKRGIGQLLLGHLLAWLEARSCPTVLLDASMSGVLLYRRNGFQVLMFS